MTKVEVAKISVIHLKFMYSDNSRLKRGCEETFSSRKDFTYNLTVFSLQSVNDAKLPVFQFIALIFSNTFEGWQQ